MLIHVGLTQAQRVTFLTSGSFTIFSIRFPEGEHHAVAHGNLIMLDDVLLAPPIDIIPKTRGNEKNTFTISQVTIGNGFHWQRKEAQQFQGALRLSSNERQVLVINTLDVEQYLFSVISSEMKATNDLQLLKAHAIISRSWLISQLQSRQRQLHSSRVHAIDRDDMRVRWYDRDDHMLFDVCADDHCQRYQGILRADTPLVERAIDETRHMVLVDKNDNICDTRFSKCCGGQTETYETCWDDTPHPYLVSIRDNDDLGKPDFCARADKQTLRQILNSYDNETSDFYRWTVSYTQDELQALLNRKLDIDFGDVIDLEPISRGPGGHIILLKIVGSKRQLTIGKELEIRKTLSESCLYSANFTVQKSMTPGDDSRPCSFTLHGKGWGHGVGLCQIGAAQMAKEGYSFDKILDHYFPNTRLTTHDL